MRPERSRSKLSASVSAEKILLDADALSRTLSRIAHEIVEKTGGQGVAVVGIHRRGAVLAARLRDLVAELVGEPVPLGDIDISFYRDDLDSRPPDAQPVVHASHVDFPVEDTTIVLVDDVLYTGRTVRAAIDALFDYGRPRRVQLAVLADQVGHQVAHPRGQHGAATVDPDDRDPFASRLLDDLVCDAHQRAPHVLAVEDRLLAQVTPLPGLTGPG